MKAWVIKRDDGKYLVGPVALSNKLCSAFIWEKEQDAIDVATEKYGCQVVSITIIEGDIEEHDEASKNAKAVEALEKVKECCNETFYVGNGFSKPQTLNNIKYYIDQLIKEYGGKNE